MQIILLLFSQLLSYSPLSWAAFALIAFCAARYGGWWLVPVGHLMVAAIICFLDMCWIQEEMSKPGWNGQPDMDAVFDLGVVLRILLINTTLLPITKIGLWRRRVSHRGGQTE
jgi:hypothetical protein